MEKWRVRRGDNVVVISGKDTGKSGEILRVLKDRMRVVVAGVNMIKRHVKPSYTHPNGGIIQKEATIHVSNIAHVDPASGLPTKVGYRFLEDGKKVRYAKRSGETIG